MLRMDFRSITRYGVYDRINKEGAIEIMEAMKYFHEFKYATKSAKECHHKYPVSARMYLKDARKNYDAYKHSMKKIYQLFGKNINWRIDWYKQHGETPTAEYLYNLPVSKEDTAAWLKR